MMTRDNRLMCASWCILLVVGAGGCASLKLPKSPVADVAPERKSRTREAIDSYERRREVAQFQAALDAWSRSDVDGCQETLRRLLRQNPAHREAALLLAELFQETDRSAAAVEVLEKLLVHHPADATVLHALGLSLDLQGKTEAALGYFEQAAIIEPGNELFAASIGAARQPPENLPLIADDGSTVPIQDGAPQHSSIRLVDSVDPRASRVRSAGKLTSGPNMRFVAQGPAGHLLRQAEDALVGGAVVAGRDFLRQAISLAPDNPQIPISAASIALQNAQPQLAIELLQEVDDVFPLHAGIYQSLSLAFYRAGNYEASQVSAEHALSLDNSSPLTYFLVGSSAARMGNADEADWYLRQARSMDPRYGASR